MLDKLIEEERRIFDIFYEAHKTPVDEEEIYKKINQELNNIIFNEKPNAPIDVDDVITACIRAMKKQNNKIQKAIDFINNENNFFEDGENWQNVLKIKEILEEN